MASGWSQLVLVMLVSWLVNSICLQIYFKVKDDETGKIPDPFCRYFTTCKTNHIHSRIDLYYYIYSIYIYHHIIYLYISVFVDVDTTNKEIPSDSIKAYLVRTPMLRPNSSKIESKRWRIRWVEVGRVDSLDRKTSDFFSPPPNGGGLLREFPGYFRRIQVDEILFHLAPIKTKCFFFTSIPGARDDPN